MSLLEALLLLAAGVGGGGLNAIVGGGTFVAFPALVFVGLEQRVANATTALALWPGGAASAFAYREHLDRTRGELAVLGAVSLLGGALGGWLLLATRESSFAKAVPWLLLVATLAFTFGPRATARLEPGAERPRGALAFAAVIQLAIAIYGGYFGGGMGILMLAAWSLLSFGGIHALNALRNLLSIAINGVALVQFVVAGAVAWKPGLVVMAGALAGGWVGARLATRVEPKKMRVFVVLVAWVMTAIFFARTYASR